MLYLTNFNTVTKEALTPSVPLGDMSIETATLMHPEPPTRLSHHCVVYPNGVFYSLFPVCIDRSPPLINNDGVVNN